MGSDLPACSVYTPDPVSIHAPRMGSDNDGGRSRGTIEVSIHAPRMGSDGAQTTRTGSLPLFQSTLPAWGATTPGNPTCAAHYVSIHAPRMGSDLNLASSILSALRFNPRSPHGERPPHPGGSCVGAMFQSTLPAWGATSYSVPVVARGLFQSTLPAWGATAPKPPGRGVCPCFNPRSPHGERLVRCQIDAATPLSFNPRSPHGERQRSPE